MSITDRALTELLARDYRRLLRWYPRAWRQSHGEALLGILMDDADAADRFTLQRGEWRSFAVAGLSARLDRLIARRVRDALATVLLTLGAGAAIVEFVTAAWAPWAVDAVPPGGISPFRTVVPLLAAFWTAACVAAALDRWWLGRGALALAIVVAIGQRPPAVHLFHLTDLSVAFTVACAALAVIGRPRAGLPPVGATLGWVGLSAIAGYVSTLPYANPLQSSWDSATGLLSGSAYGVAVLVGVSATALALGLARSWTAGFVTALATVPAIAGLDAALLSGTVLAAPGSVLDTATIPWMLSTFAVVALVLVVLFSQGALELPQRRRRTDVTPTP